MIPPARLSSRSKAGHKKTSGIDAERKLNEIYGTKYGIRLDHQQLTDYGVFYPRALYNDLVFELTLAPASQVVKGSNPTKLKYKLTNILLGHEMIRSETLTDEARSVYTNGKGFAYDHGCAIKFFPSGKDTDSRLTIKVHAQRRSMKAILLLFVEPYAADNRNSENASFLGDLESRRDYQRLAGHAVQRRNQ